VDSVTVMAVGGRSDNSDGVEMVSQSSPGSCPTGTPQTANLGFTFPCLSVWVIGFLTHFGDVVA
jgi:hypothetical protein